MQPLSLSSLQEEIAEREHEESPHYTLQGMDGHDDSFYDELEIQKPK
jgi:hypothetical protein